jgi:hypothetical protein
MSVQQSRTNAGPNREWVEAFSDEVMQRVRCNESDRIFSVNGFAKRNLSIIDQQRRASNLVWVLARRGIVTGERKVAIIGGGFAGLT